MHETAKHTPFTSSRASRAPIAWLSSHTSPGRVLHATEGFFIVEHPSIEGKSGFGLFILPPISEASRSARRNNKLNGGLCAALGRAQSAVVRGINSMTPDARPVAVQAPWRVASPRFFQLKENTTPIFIHLHDRESLSLAFPKAFLCASSQPSIQRKPEPRSSCN